MAGIVSHDPTNTTIVFTPSSPLAINTLFTATITTGAQNPAGKALASNYVWTFTTGSTADNTKPTVIPTNPPTLLPIATGVPLSQKITATFSEEMDPATLVSPAMTFTVKNGVNPVAGTVTYAGQTAIFTPALPLAANTTYDATITTAATDTAFPANALAANYLWSFTTGAVSDAVAPTVISEVPAKLLPIATGVPINQAISAKFSKAMDPSTISNTTFRLTGPPGVTAVSGTVAYDVASDIATFTPDSNLASNVTYRATIKTGAKDLEGIALASDFIRSFTTGSAVSTGPAPVDLQSAASFAIISGAGVTSTGATIINGDLGLSPPPTTVTGGPVINETTYAGPNPIAIQAQEDATDAYEDASGRAITFPVIATGELGGLTLTPGVYKSGIASFAITSSDLTLDAQGDPNAVFIFQMASTLTVLGGRSIILTNGAKASNIFWAVGSSATIDGCANVSGTIMAVASVVFKTGAILNGRAFAQTAAVTLDTNTVTVPAP